MAAWNRRDLDAWAEGFTEDVVWDVGDAFLDQEPVEGREALRRWGHSVFRAWDDLRLEVLEMREEPQRLVTRIRMSGRIRATGLDLEQHVDQIFEFRGEELKPSRLEIRRIV